MPDHQAPTEEALLGLPRWARVAFAARCARRVQPLFAGWPRASEKNVAGIDGAIATAEKTAGSGGSAG